MSTNGSDAASGSISSPWASVNHANSLLKPGDTLYIRAGTYNQTVDISAAGTANAPVTISGYPGEQPIFDGQLTLPATSWSSLFAVEGANVVVRNLTVRRSNWVGLVLKGQNDRAAGVRSENNLENGILVTGAADLTTVEDCDVYYNAASNENFQGSRGGWSTGLSCARGPQNVVLRGNRVWNNWGEGLSVYESEHVLLEGNTVYDNKLNVYISDARYCTVTGNLIYSTAGNVCSNISQVGIGLGDEQYNPPSSDNVIINNLLLGNAKNIYYWPGVSGGGLVNVTIAYNTAVNSSVESDLKIGSGNHTNSVIQNNIFLQKGTLPVAVTAGTSGISLNHNLWSSTPPGACSGIGDVICDPKLAQTGIIAPGLLTRDWFRFSSVSCAVGKALAMADVTTDFAGNPRGKVPDVGALQHLPEAPTNLRVSNSPSAQ